MAEATDHDYELRQAVMEKLQRQINNLDMLKRVQKHLQAGGSTKHDWVRDFLARLDEDDT